MVDVQSQTLDNQTFQNNIRECLGRQFFTAKCTRGSGKIVHNPAKLNDRILFSVMVCFGPGL